ncbi:MAG TPA: hypothetical protein VMF89_03375, partial [Polyangiales bacterium]|nr:hypothetical protein [Polyangiales bacterium]
SSCRSVGQLFEQLRYGAARADFLQLPRRPVENQGMQASPSPVSGIPSMITTLCERLESGEIAMGDAHNVLVSLHVSRWRYFLEPADREDLTAFLRALCVFG